MKTETLEKPNKNKLAYSYRRYSSRSQDDNTSLERQLDMAKKVCADRGWQLVDLPADAGVSGFKGLNKVKGALGSFLGKVKSGEIANGILILEKIDRFSRNEIDLVLPDFLSLLQAGIEIYSCSDSTLYTLADLRKGPLPIIQMVMAIVAANEYSKALSSRVSASVSIRIKEMGEGKVVNMGGNRPRWITLKKDKFVLNAKADTVKEIIAAYLDGKTKNSIAKELNKANTPTITGCKIWAPGTINHLLRNETLLGNVNLKGKVFPSYYPPIIEKEKWQALQSLLQTNSNRKGNTSSGNVVNLFRNRCICSECGGTVGTHNTNGYSYYICSNARKGRCDVKKMLKIDRLEQDFFLNYLGTTPGTLVRGSNTEFNAPINALKSNLIALEVKLKATIADYEESPSKTLAAILAGTETKIAELQGELTNIEQKRLATLAAPSVLRNIKTILASKDDVELSKVANHVRHSLTVPEHRAKLLLLLPSLVQGLSIDLEKQSYSVRVGDKLSEYRTLTKYNNSIS